MRHKLHSLPQRFLLSEGGFSADVRKSLLVGVIKEEEKKEKEEILCHMAAVSEQVSYRFNPKCTGLFPPGAAMGGGVFSTPSVKLDPDTLES